MAYDDPGEWEWGCQFCEGDVVFVGTLAEASGECATCGELNTCCPAEVLESIAAEAAGDARRDGDI